MTATTIASVELAMLPLESIRVEDGFNPRSSVDVEKLAKLVESIRQHGVLQPIVVTAADEDGSHTVIAGHRRLEAARAADLDEIPVLIRTVDGDALTLAMTENLQRADLDPIEQAHAFERVLRSSKLSQKKLAARLSVSPALVAERLRLLRLPGDVQQAIADERLPLRLAKPLEAIAKISPELASGCAALVAAGICKPHELEEQPAQMIEAFSRVEWTGEQPFAVRVGGWSRLSLADLPIAMEEVAIDVRGRAEKLPGGFWLSLGDEDADAARAYGCLLEFKQDRHFRIQFITDRSFLEDRLRLHLDHAEQRQADQARVEAERAAQRQSRDGENTAEGAVREVEAKAVRTAEYQTREQAKREAQAANLELGRKLIVEYSSAALSKDIAKLLALLILDANKELAGRGLRYCFEDWQQIESKPLKNGSTREKVTYLERREAQEKLCAWIERARTPEEILGRLLQALIAGGCADQEAVAQGSRVYHELPGRYGDGPSTQIPALVDRLAKRVLPRRLAEQARERHTERQRYTALEANSARDDGEAEELDRGAEIGGEA